MLSEEDYYKFYYENGRCIDQFSIPKNPLNSRTLSTKYEKYVKKENRKLGKTVAYKGSDKDTSWEEVKKEVWVRDQGKCRLLEILPKELFTQLKKNSGGLHNVIDPAHVFKKSSHPECYYDKDCIVLLNRFSHSMLDQQKSPVFGTPITNQEMFTWWSYIVGEDLFDTLIDRYNIILLD